MTKPPYSRGATVFETTVTIFVIAILVSGFGTALYSTTLESRRIAAQTQLEGLKKAIVGEPRSVPQGEKSLIRHGYIGDMGALPPALDALETIGVQPEYEVNSLIQIGRGWRGPYVSSAIAAGLIDPWGNALIYNTTPTISALTGSAVVATIRSSGPDRQSATAADKLDDHVIEIYRSESFADVVGYVKDGFGTTLSGIGVQLSSAVDGSLGVLSTVTDDEGLYTFNSIAHGVRVLQVTPKLSYQRGTGFTTGGNRNNVEFVVENMGSAPTTITNVKISWMTDPDSDFKRLLINGAERYNGTAASGATLSTTTYNIAGSGVSPEPFRVDVSSLQMLVPDAIIGSVGTGGSLKFELEDFEEAGTNTNIDVTGVTFTVEFSDSSKTVFSPLRK
jgi:hypothetical protein